MDDIKIKSRILSGLCAISLAFGMSRTKSDAKLVNYAFDAVMGGVSSCVALLFADLLWYEELEKDFKQKKFAGPSIIGIVNVLVMVDYCNRIVDAKYVQNLEAELQKLKNPDKKVNKATDGKNVDSKEPKQI